MLDFLAQNNLTYKAEFQLFVEQLSSNTEASREFMDGYLDKGKLVPVVIKALSKIWPGIWDSLMVINTYEQAKLDRYFKSILTYTDVPDLIKINNSGQFAVRINTDPDFLKFTADIDQKRLEEVLMTLNVEFPLINYSTEQADLFDFICRKSLYEINPEMIARVAQFRADHQDNLAVDLQKKNYTTLLKIGFEPMINYIHANIELYLNDVFFAIEENTGEEEKSILKLLNDQTVSEDSKINIISVQDTLYEHIESLPGSLWTTVIEENKLKPTWPNLITYLNSDGFDADHLNAYLNREDNYILLSQHKMGKATGEEKAVTETISDFIMTNNALTDRAYSMLAQSDPFLWNLLDLSMLNPAKVDHLIRLQKLKLTKVNFANLKTHFEGKNMRLLEDNYEIYLKAPDDFPLDTADLILLLRSAKISTRQKMDVILKIEPSLVNNRTIAELVSRMVLEYKQAKVNYELLTYLVAYNTADQLNVALLLLHYSLLDKEQIEAVLGEMSHEYQKLVVKTSRPVLPQDRDNEFLLMKLQNDGIISSFKKQKNKFFVYTKRK